MPHDQRGGHCSCPNRGGHPQNLDPVGADKRDVDASGDQRLEGSIAGRLLEAIEPSALQIGDSRCEHKSQQGAESKHVFGITAAICMVAANRNIALVVEQPVEDMQGFTCCRGNRLGVERRIAIREVGVELTPGLVAIVGVEPCCIATGATGSEELAVRRRDKAAAKYRRQGLALLLSDQAPQCQSISLVTNVPVSCPGELTKAGDGAGLCHARQAQIQSVSEEPRHQNPFVRMPTGSVRRTLYEAFGRPAISTKSSSFTASLGASIHRYPWYISSAKPSFSMSHRVRRRNWMLWVKILGGWSCRASRRRSPTGVADKPS